MNSHEENPGTAPDAGRASRLAAESDRAARGACLHSDLPRNCPACDHLFNMRFYPRKHQKKTILYLILSTVVALFACAFFPGLIRWVVFILVVSSLGGIAMRWPKVVHLKWRSCGWSQKYVVRNPR